jgi:hypothetical protein
MDGAAVRPAGGLPQKEIGDLDPGQGRDRVGLVHHDGKAVLLRRSGPGKAHHGDRYQPKSHPGAARWLTVRCIDRWFGGGAGKPWTVRLQPVAGV